MSCSTVDVKEYLFGELPEAERGAVRNHLTGCEECREELSRLELTQAALFSLRDEEVPQRIAFVSDKVFEPRWWQTLWRSGPVMGFASALVLACAILAHGALSKPAVAQAPSRVVQVAQVDPAEVDRRVHDEVAKAVAAVEARQQERVRTMLQVTEKRYEFQRRADMIAAAENYNILQKQLNQSYVAVNRLSSPGEAR